MLNATKTTSTCAQNAGHRSTCLLVQASATVALERTSDTCSDTCSETGPGGVSRVRSRASASAVQPNARALIPMTRYVALKSVAAHSTFAASGTATWLPSWLPSSEVTAIARPLARR